MNSMVIFPSVFGMFIRGYYSCRGLHLNYFNLWAVTSQDGSPLRWFTVYTHHHVGTVIYTNHYWKLLVGIIITYYSYGFFPQNPQISQRCLVLCRPVTNHLPALNSSSSEGPSSPHRSQLDVCSKVQSHFYWSQTILCEYNDQSQGSLCDGFQQNLHAETHQ